jgi:NAD(P)-dependent dehydrogenase (short-subunit alcohol dehydrogenase family)
MGRLQSRRILVTGAAGGMGQVACGAFSAEGARVLGTDLQEPPPGLQMEAYLAADLATPDGRQAVLDACRRELGGLDGLYSNHGVILARRFEETTPDDWARIMAVNLESVYFLVQGSLPLLVDGASVVLVASAAGLGALPAMSAYSAAKGALVMLARSLAVDLAARGIRVNAIAPGLVDTPMPRGFVAGLPDPEATWRGMLAANLLGRAGRPTEVVSLGVHLLSEESGFTTGAVFPVDGGRLAT